MMKKRPFIALMLFCSIASLPAQAPAKWSARMAATLMQTYPDSVNYDRSKPARWDYELGLYLYSLEQLWRQTASCTMNCTIHNLIVLIIFHIFL